MAGPSRSRGTVFAFCAALWFLAGGGGAQAQANSPGENGVGPQQSEPMTADDKAFDCAAFKQAIGAAADGFKPLRGATRQDDATIARYAVAAPLFGSCEILDKKKVGEVSYSCQASKLSLADLKATIDACLGDKAFARATNENPNTPYLVYNPRIDGAKARVMALATFGAKTLAIFSPR